MNASETEKLPEVKPAENGNMCGSAPLLIFCDFQPRTKLRKLCRTDCGIITCPLKISPPLPRSRSEQRLGWRPRACACRQSSPWLLSPFRALLSMDGVFALESFSSAYPSFPQAESLCYLWISNPQPNRPLHENRGAAGFWRTIPVSA